MFITSLYKDLEEDQGVFIVGFADDTTLLAFGTLAAETRVRLEAAWEICANWARITFKQDKAKPWERGRPRPSGVCLVKPPGPWSKTHEPRSVGGIDPIAVGSKPMVRGPK
ncbi:hypothetical protein BGZ61DRAFT_540436 [Ilyonectria robusta]|uniref:uncharacterized protein n=1 Tax=Ilyonectria robusta TaxID=1079257 RepID=UPI001E8E2E3A|nr:uncharacterized protein BGZ61DRAFT_540436 [Ilyonectria robusta]KAH8658927.1 hypothetical protein BGZ61DRAFT_540436 [Ilyonectria robusta]